MTSTTSCPLTKEEWLDLIVENYITDEQIDRIIENERLRVECERVYQFYVDCKSGECAGVMYQIFNESKIGFIPSTKGDGCK